MIKQIDINMAQFDLDNISEAHTKSIKEQWENMQQTVRLPTIMRLIMLIFISATFSV